MNAFFRGCCSYVKYSHRVRLLLCTALLALAMALSACGKTAPVAPPKAEPAVSTTSAPTQSTTPVPPQTKPASFSVSNLTVTPAEVTAGTTVAISVLVTNSGEQSGSYDVVLKIDGMTEATEQVVLGGGTSQKVIFTRTKTAVKIYTVTIGELAQTFLVKASTPAPSPPPSEPKPFIITSTAFQNNSQIPLKHTCTGQDVSPPLTWSNPPTGTKSFALVCDDPDAPGGVWVHWVIFNIPATASQLPEGVLKQVQLADGTLQGINDFKQTSYGGPCPPPGTPHHYRFILYALDQTLTLSAGASKSQLVAAMQGHILGEVQLVGLYGR